MARRKISSLAVADPLTGAELLPVVQGAATRAATLAQVATKLGQGASDDATTKANAARDEAIAAIPTTPVTATGTSTTKPLPDWLADVARSTSRLGTSVRVTSDDIDVTGVANASAILQGFINTAQAQNKELILPPRAVFRLDAELTINQGRAASADARQQIRLIGNEASFRPTFAGYAVTVLPLCTTANAGGTGNQVGDVDIESVQFSLGGNAAAKAIKVGRAGYVMDAFRIPKLSNILMENGSDTHALYIEGAVRHFRFERVVGRAAGCGVYLRNATDGAFQGDIDFDLCEFAGTVAKPPLQISAFCASVSSQIRGLSFRGLKIYGTGTKIDVSGPALVGDMWFSSGCQWDGPGAPAGETAFDLYTTNNGAIFDVFMEHPYAKNYTGRFLVAGAGTGGTINNVKMNGGVLSGFSPQSTGNNVIRGLGVSGIRVANVDFSDITGATGSTSSYINFDGCTNVFIENNRGTQKSVAPANAPGYFVIIGNASNNFKITDNFAKVATGMVNDYSSGAPVRDVRNNTAAA